MQVVNSGMRFSATATDVHGLPPYLGEHNREVVVDLLGLAEEYDALTEAGILYRDGRADEHPSY
jgi:hypothetical protein